MLRNMCVHLAFAIMFASLLPVDVHSTSGLETMSEEHLLESIKAENYLVVLFSKWNNIGRPNFSRINAWHEFYRIFQADKTVRNARQWRRRCSTCRTIFEKSFRRERWRWSTANWHGFTARKESRSSCSSATVIRCSTTVRSLQTKFSQSSLKTASRPSKNSPTRLSSIWRKRRPAQQPATGLFCCTYLFLELEKSAFQRNCCQSELEIMRFHSPRQLQSRMHRMPTTWGHVGSGCRGYAQSIRYCTNRYRFTWGENGKTFQYTTSTGVCIVSKSLTIDCNISCVLIRQLCPPFCLKHSSRTFLSLQNTKIWCPIVCEFRKTVL